MRASWFVVLVVHYVCFSNADSGGFGNFDMILEKLTECQHPQPPLSGKRKITFEYEIRRVGNKTYISGHSVVLAEVPFKNLSVSTFAISSSGRQELKFHAKKLNCRSLIGQVFLVFGNIHYTKNNCLLIKAKGSFKDVDVNKIVHSIPSWHSEGKLMSRVQLVHFKDTIFCYKYYISVKSAK